MNQYFFYLVSVVFLISAVVALCYEAGVLTAVLMAAAFATQEIQRRRE